MIGLKFYRFIVFLAIFYSVMGKSFNVNFSTFSVEARANVTFFNTGWWNSNVQTFWTCSQRHIIEILNHFTAQSYFSWYHFTLHFALQGCQNYHYSALTFTFLGLMCGICHLDVECWNWFECWMFVFVIYFIQPKFWNLGDLQDNKIISFEVRHLYKSDLYFFQI